MLITLLRTVLIYFFVIVVLRLMGKRQVGELESSELVVTIMISELAVMPIQDAQQPILGSVIGILMLLIIEVFLSFFTYKNNTVRKIVYGTPSVFVEKGKIKQREMENQRFNVNDLMEELRNNGVGSLSEVEYVIMETNGNVSVIMNSQSRTVTPRDLSLNPPSVEISYIIIDSGKVNNQNLKQLGYDKCWLSKILSERGIKSVGDVFYMSADRDGNVYFLPRYKEGTR